MFRSVWEGELTRSEVSDIFQGGSLTIKSVVEIRNADQVIEIYRHCVSE